MFIKRGLRFNKLHRSRAAIVNGQLSQYHSTNWASIHLEHICLHFSIHAPYTSHFEDTGTMPKVWRMTPRADLITYFPSLTLTKFLLQSHDKVENCVPMQKRIQWKEASSNYLRVLQHFHILHEYDNEMNLLLFSPVVHLNMSITKRSLVQSSLVCHADRRILIKGKTL